MMECETRSQREAALQLVCALWDREVPLVTRNELLLSLLTACAAQEQEGWCIAVLRIGCYPMLGYVATQARVSFTKAVGGFDDAVRSFRTSEARARTIKRQLASRAVNFARGEDRAGLREETAARRAAEESKLNPLADVLSGLVVDPLEGITEERAREILTYLAASGSYQILPRDIEPILLKLYYPDVAPRDRERKQKERALARVDKTKGVTKLPPLRLGQQGDASPRKKRK